MKLGSFSFVWVILVCGVLCLAIIIGNLGVLGLNQYPQETRLYVNGGVPERGSKLIAKYGCGGCHSISGVHSATGRAGPKLNDLDQQIYIAGEFMNSPENLVKWIQDPRHLSPGTAMPDLNVTEQDAKDIAAYLLAD